MPANNSKNSKAPVKAEPVAAAPTPQKGGKATKADSAPKVVEAAPVAEVKQKGGKAVAAKEVAPKAVVEAKAAPVQKAGAKKAAPAKEVAAAPEAKKGGAKKAAAPKAPKAAKAEKKEVVDEEGDDDSKGVRSFKVQLPGNEDYTGRFTGLTPYQAANKALSKYFRENKNAKTEITFSIRESTRGSKRSTYTYNGKREKLSTPVKYSIKSADGVAREIVKEYKNKLTKVKKSETKEASA
jgi:hypothetical protein